MVGTCCRATWKYGALDAFIQIELWFLTLCSTFLTTFCLKFGEVYGSCTEVSPGVSSDLKAALFFFRKKPTQSSLYCPPSQITDIFGLILHLPTLNVYFVRELLLLYASDFIWLDWEDGAGVFSRGLWRTVWHALSWCNNHFHWLYFIFKLFSFVPLSL